MQNSLHFARSAASSDAKLVVDGSVERGLTEQHVVLFCVLVSSGSREIEDAPGYSSQATVSTRKRLAESGGSDQAMMVAGQSGQGMKRDVAVLKLLKSLYWIVKRNLSLDTWTALTTGLFAA